MWSSCDRQDDNDGLKKKKKDNLQSSDRKITVGVETVGVGTGYPLQPNLSCTFKQEKSP